MLDRTSVDVASSDLAGKQIGARRIVLCISGRRDHGRHAVAGGAALSAGGFGLVDAVLLGLFALTLPWTVIGFWNSAIGLLIMRFAADPVAAVMPAAARVRGDEPITASTAILLCIRNEAPERTIRSLVPMLDGLAASGAADRFHLYVLSDTGDPAIAAEEERAFASLVAQWRDRLAITYRRREREHRLQGRQHPRFLRTLGSDVRFRRRARCRQHHDGRRHPAHGADHAGRSRSSASCRASSSGCRRPAPLPACSSSACGSACAPIPSGQRWWQGDCGPYWGHNAVIRLAPFIAHCQLPPLHDEGGAERHILSHDQIEAALMRRAGYDVRVLRARTWAGRRTRRACRNSSAATCAGAKAICNTGRSCRCPGLTAVSRYHLAFAILMFLGSPAWMGLLIVGTLALAFSPSPAAFIQPDAGLALFVLTLTMWFAPKIATAIDVLMRPQMWKAFGGIRMFISNVVLETIFFTLLCPIMWFGHTIFMSGLPFGRGIGWIGQTRDDHVVPWSEAVHDLWPHTLLGLGAIAVLAATHPAAIPYALFLAGGPALSIPLAVLTANPRLGLAMVRFGIGRLPEETDPPAELRALSLPAMAAATPPPPR